MSEKSDSGELARPSPAAADANAIWNDVVSPVAKTEVNKNQIFDSVMLKVLIFMELVTDEVSMGCEFDRKM